MDGVDVEVRLLQHPKLQRTTYRLPDKRWSAFHLWEEFHAKVANPNFSVKVELQHAKKQVWMRLEGALSAADAEGLGQRIRDSLARSKAGLVLDLNKLHWDKVDDLRPLREKLAAIAPVSVWFCRSYQRRILSCCCWPACFTITKPTHP